MTPYMDYHPGGEEELMKAAGIDGTDLFDQVWEPILLNVLKGKVCCCFLRITVTVNYFFQLDGLNVTHCFVLHLKFIFSDERPHSQQSTMSEWTACCVISCWQIVC